MEELYYGPYRDTTNYASDAFMHINSAGVSAFSFQEDMRSIRILRPEGRVDYQLLLVTDGCLAVDCRGEQYNLHPGDAMLYFPGDRQEYTYYPPASIRQAGHRFVHFSGVAVEEAMGQISVLTSGPFYALPVEMKAVFDELIHQHSRGNSLAAIGCLLRLLSFLPCSGDVVGGNSVRSVLTEAMMIRTHFTEKIDFALCAKRCHLSRSRFTHLFAKVMGTSPTKYQQKLRMEQAIELLLYSDRTVGEIAQSVGFEDPLYFSRLFRHVMGVSPRKFRQSK